MTDRSALDVRLSDLAHFDRAHNAGVHVVLFQHILQRQRVDHRCQHAHVVCRGTINAALCASDAAPDVAAADHAGHFHAQRRNLSDLFSQRVERVALEAVADLTSQRLPAQFDNHTFILSFHSHTPMLIEDCLFTLLLLYHTLCALSTRIVRLSFTVSPASCEKRSRAGSASRQTG